ncbi:MAG: hypothetical protein PVG30_09295 [Gammaproteobacteria bacterium]
MKEMQELRKDFLISCKDDSTGLWEVIRSVKNILKIYDSQIIKNTILSMVLEFLMANYIVVGFPMRDGSFQAWEGSPEELVRKIKYAWDILDREPNIGDVIWFYITSVGKEELKRLQKCE